MLKLLLLSSAYAIIVKVVQDIKLGTVTEERHHGAQQLQSTLEHIILNAEQNLKTTSTQLARQHFEKVCLRYSGGCCVLSFVSICLFSRGVSLTLTVWVIL